MTVKRVVTSHNKAIVRMKYALGLWASDCRKKNTPLDMNTIHEKARQLYGKFTDDGDNSQPGTSMASPAKPNKFTAS